MRWPWSRKKQTTVQQDEAVPYVIIRGRRMKVDSPYMFPKDMGESNRLDLQHYMLRYILRGNYVAPVRRPQSVLDVGCGAGRWGGEMARQFPQANVVGLDLTLPSAESLAVTQAQGAAPDNYAFIEGDITKGLPFTDNTFDFVHMRLVVLALPSNAWAPAIQEIKRVTKPGGWIELVDTSVTPRAPGSRQWVEWAQTLARYRGIDMTAGARIGQFLREAGLHRVQEIPLEIPIGPWGGRVGNLMLADAMAGARALETPVVDMAKLATKPQFDAAVAAMEHDFRTLPNCTQPFYVAYGQK